MKFHIPILYKNKTYTNYELKNLKNGVVANATEEMREKGDFSGMLQLVAGTLKSVSTDDGDEITKDFQGIAKAATIQQVEILALQALTRGKDISVDQVSKCPRCGDTVYYEDDEDDEDNDRPGLRYDDLIISEYDGEQLITIQLEEFLHVKTKKGDILMEIYEIGFRYPLLRDAIKATSKVSFNKDMRRMFAIYAESIVSINGDPVDSKFTNMWANFIIERMDLSDLNKLSEPMSKCGIQKTVKRECQKCGKKWKQPFNLSGFFEYGLQL